MRSARWSLVILLSLPLSAATARPQPDTPPGQQQDPLAEAARRAKEQKKNQQKTGRVWDNDNIPEADGNAGINVVGPPSSSDTAAPAPSEKTAAKPATGKKSEPASGSDEKEAVEAELKAAKEQLASLKTDLDIAQRKYQLDYQSLMGRPGSNSDRDAAATLQDEKSQVDAKQQEVADAQKKVDELKSKLDALNDASSK